MSLSLCSDVIKGCALFFQPARTAVKASDPYPYEERARVMHGATCIGDEGAIRENYDLLKKKLQLTKNVMLMYSPPKCARWGEAYGSFLRDEHPRIIVLNRNAVAIDPDAMWVTTKHELAHLRNSDQCLQDAAKIASQVAVAIFLFRRPLVPVICAQIVVSKIVEKTCDRFAEIFADRFAFHDASETELEAGVRLFKAFQLAVSHYEKSRLRVRGFTFTAKYYTRKLFGAHPSPESRLQYVEGILKKKNPHADLAKIKSDPRINRLVDYFVFGKLPDIPKSNTRITIDDYDCYLPDLTSLRFISRPHHNATSLVSNRQSVFKADIIFDYFKRAQDCLSAKATALRQKFSERLSPASQDSSKIDELVCTLQNCVI